MCIHFFSGELDVEHLSAYQYSQLWSIWELLWTKVRIFILSVLGSSQWVLSRGMMCPVIGFTRFILAAI